MARRRRSGLGVLARRTLVGWAVALKDHHPAGVARASPSRGFTVHICDRVFHVGLVPRKPEPVPVMKVRCRGFIAVHSEFLPGNCTTVDHRSMLAGGVLLTKGKSAT